MCARGSRTVQVIAGVCPEFWACRVCHRVVFTSIPLVRFCISVACVQRAVYFLSACFRILQRAQGFPSVTSPRFGSNGLFVFLGFVMGLSFFWLMKSARHCTRWPFRTHIIARHSQSSVCREFICNSSCAALLFLICLAECVTPGIHKRCYLHDSVTPSFKTHCEIDKTEKCVLVKRYCHDCFKHHLKGELGGLGWGSRSYYRTIHWVSLISAFP